MLKGINNLCITLNHSQLNPDPPGNFPGNSVRRKRYAVLPLDRTLYISEKIIRGSRFIRLFRFRVLRRWLLTLFSTAISSVTVPFGAKLLRIWLVRAPKRDCSPKRFRFLLFQGCLFFPPGLIPSSFFPKTWVQR